MFSVFACNFAAQTQVRYVREDFIDLLCTSSITWQRYQLAQPRLPDLPQMVSSSSSRSSTPMIDLISIYDKLHSPSSLPHSIVQRASTSGTQPTKENMLPRMDGDWIESCEEDIETLEDDPASTPQRTSHIARFIFVRDMYT